MDIILDTNARCPTQAAFARVEVFGFCDELWYWIPYVSRRPTPSPKAGDRSGAPNDKQNAQSRTERTGHPSPFSTLTPAARRIWEGCAEASRGIGVRRLPKDESFPKWTCTFVTGATNEFSCELLPRALGSK